MTWQELCEKAKEIGYENYHGCLRHSDYYLKFYSDGDIYVDNGCDILLVADFRTPSQMYQIMKALQ